MLRPTVVHVEPMKDYLLYLEFDNGEKKLFDVKPYIHGDFYGQLADEEYFKKVKANGFSVKWPKEQDLRPDELYKNSIPLIYKYELDIHWSQDDNLYIISVPSLPGCMADGATPEIAIQNAKVTIDEWCETAKKEGREVPEPISLNYATVEKRKDRDTTIKKIVSLLEDMSDIQLQNVYHYACDEYDKEDHENHCLEMMVQSVKDNTQLEMN